MARSLDIGSLKVADLKAELSKRGLPTNGLKKDLVSRLQQAEEADGGDGNDDAKADSGSGQEEPEAEEAGKAGETEPGSEKVQGVTPDETVTLAETRPEAGGETKETVVTETAEEKLEPEEEGEGGKAGEPDLEERISGEDRGRGEQQEEQADGAEVAAQTNGSSSLADRLGAKGDEEEEEAVEVGGDYEAQMEVQTEEPTFMSAVRDAQSKGGEAIEVSSGGEPLANGLEDKETSLSRPFGLSPYSEPAASLSAEEASATKAVGELDEEARKLEKSSRSIYIAGLVRPLTLPSFRAKVEEFGDLGGEGVREGHELWLDGVKTHAYVTYQDEDASMRAKEALNGTVYPPETGKEIQVFCLPHTIVDQCIEIEDQAWQQGRGKVELRAREAEDGESLVYSLHRLESSSALPRLESTLAHPSRRTDQRGAGPSTVFGSFKANARLPEPFDRRNDGTGYSRRNDFEAQSTDRRWGSRRGGPEEDAYRRRHRERYDEHGGQGSNAGSLADERVRQVEARIRADRERRSRDGFAEERHTRGPMDGGSKDRWEQPASRAEMEPRWYNRPSPARPDHQSGRSYHSSFPPTNRRDYAERPRDEFGRDRPRRD